MRFEEGNQFWKLRSKHGRNKIFSSAALLMEAAYEYFEWAETHPLYETDFRGKNNQPVKIPKMRAFTMPGLCLYLGVNSKYLFDYEDAIRDKTDEESMAFKEAIITIKEIIYNQKFTGAAAGFLHANLIARDLGLKESSELKSESVTSIKIIRE